jgi:hypothetical protein
MIALLLAAALSTTTSFTVYRGGAMPGDVLCKPEGMTHTARTDPALLLRPTDRVEFRKLAKLPKADLHQTVLRSVGGCSIPSIVRHQVEGDGRFARPDR